MPKSNEPVKLVYPNAGNQSAVLNMNNRVTFTSQSMPNGTISLSPLTFTTSSQSNPSGQTIMHTTNTTGGVKVTALQGQQSQQNQQQTLVIKNQVSMPTGISSNSPGIVTMTKTFNQANSQNMMGQQGMLPSNVQIVNMRPGTPNSQQQKNVAAVTPTRVVIGGSQMVGVRPANSGGLSFSQLQGLQSGQPGSALLLKTENGQYQLLRVGPAPGAPVTSNLGNTNSTLRLQSVPAVSRFTGPPLALRKTIVTQQVKQKQNQHTISSASSPMIVNSSLTTSTPTQIMTTTSAPPVASIAPVPALAPQNSINSQQQQQQQQQQRNTSDNTKEKCRKFLANLLELSSREPKPVEKNVRTLIQELIDSNVEPEEFCERLERLLNASPQPCLIGFLRKSLPLLRQSLVTKELVIEGIKPPPHNVAFSGATISAQIPAQVRPIGQTVGGAQVRMVTQMGARPTQTTITRHAAPVRIQGPMISGPRLMNTSVASIRPGGTTISQNNHMQHQQLQHQQSTTPPALQPVSLNQTQSVFSPATQIRTQTTITRPQQVQIRTTTPVIRGGAVPKNSTPPTLKIGQTQIKPVNASATNSLTTITNNNLNKNIAVKSGQIGTVTSGIGSGSTQKHSGTKEKEKKVASSFFQSASLAMSSSMYGDDDINDVAAMGGVNLAEESQRILGSTELIGTQIRSCKDEVFLHLPVLQNKIRAIIAKHGLDEPSNDVAVLISHATQERLKNIVEKLAVIAEHRIDIIKVDPRYEITKDVRGQLKFLEELDKAEQKRHEEQEREMLLRAAKSRSKTEDPEQAKLKAKAKEMQRAEMEELRQRDANLTALQAIGPRKKPRLDGDSTTTSMTSNTGTGSGSAPTPSRPRIKRVNLKDMLFYLEQERDSCRSTMLYKAYLK